MKDEVSGYVHIAASPEELVTKLPAPRTILIMVKAGQPVDAVIDILIPLLGKGDALVDGENSHYHDTIRREVALKEQGIYFIGLACREAGRTRVSQYIILGSEKALG